MVQTISGVTVAGQYIDRGDPSTGDYVVGNFTSDNTWRNLDLSSIVPVGAKAVLLRITIQGDVAGKALQFRKNGNSNTSNSVIARTIVANGTITYDFTVACDSGRVVEYLGSDGITWSKQNVTVGGWYT